MNNKKTNLHNAFLVLLGALLMGLLWRVRGEHGWGSSWGLLNAGFIFTMFIITVKGSREKLNLGWASLTSLAFMLTTPGWGTLLNQITGVIYRAEDWAKGGETVYTSVGSAIFLMLCLGFGLASLFGIMLGRGFSEKQWKLKHFIILLAVFFITDLIASAFISPIILHFVQPEAEEVFNIGLTIAMEKESAYEAFLDHFKDVSWAKKIDGGRNYFQSLEAITSAIKAIVSLFTVRFIIKDKTAAKTGAVVCTAFSFAITVSDLFFYFGNGGYHMLNDSYLPEFFYPWGCWEYFTGFIAGGIITAFIIKLKPKTDMPELAFGKVPEKVSNVITFLLGTVFMIGVNIVRPVLVRFSDSGYMTIATVIAILFALAVILLFVKYYGINATRSDIQKYASGLLFFFIAYLNIVYLFVGTEDCTHFLRNTGFQHSMALFSVIVLIIWLAFSDDKNKKIQQIKGDNYEF